MNIAVISIGNSKGIRLPKAVIDKYHISESVELILEKERIVLKPQTNPRKGWDKAFKKMHEKGEDQQVIPDIFEDESFEEWK